MLKSGPRGLLEPEGVGEAGDGVELHAHDSGRAGITRHNPHPHRCVHISALQGGQVPNIVDDGIPVDFHICYPPVRPETLRAAAANPSSLRPLVKVQHLEQFREMTARSASAAGSEAWRCALSQLTRETFDVAVSSSSSSSNNRGSWEWQNRPVASSKPVKQREQHRLYSPLTGRLRQLPTMQPGPRTPADFEKLELLQSSIMGMLCRILQTKDERAVRAWLLGATPRERSLVSDIIRSSIANRDEYFAASALELENRRSDLPASPTRSRTSATTIAGEQSAAAATAAAAAPPALSTRTARSGGSNHRRSQPTSQGTAACSEVSAAEAAASDEARITQRQQRQQPLPPAGRKTGLPATSIIVVAGGPDGSRTGARKQLCEPGHTRRN